LIGDEQLARTLADLFGIRLEPGSRFRALHHDQPAAATPKA
jgi:hypothetical protein